MVIFFQNLINALQWGSFYALIALGYSMVYSILMLFNFAHGDIFMVGAYIGFGTATFIRDLKEKQAALKIIMAHYSDATFAFPENKVNATAVIKVDIESMTGKQSGC